MTEEEIETLVKNVQGLIQQPRRDWFAGLAMRELLAGYVRGDLELIPAEGVSIEHKVASNAVAIADAMLAGLANPMEKSAIVVAHR